jgi:NADH-quinone oxidoreductase subunit G
VNTAGEWQSSKGIAKAFGSSRPAWKVLRVLANFLRLEGFEQQSAEEVKHEIKDLVAVATTVSSRAPSVARGEGSPYGTTERSHLSRIGEIPIYAIDSLTRHAEPLQRAQQLMEGEIQVVRLHPETAATLKVTAGDSVRVKQHIDEVELSVVLDTRIAPGAAWIAGGIEATSELGDLLGGVEIKKC